jgi:hypothetical protein
VAADFMVQISGVTSATASAVRNTPIFSGTPVRPDSVFAETAAIKRRLDVLERPRIARVVLPPRTEPGGA